MSGLLLRGLWADKLEALFESNATSMPNALSAWRSHVREVVRAALDQDRHWDWKVAAHLAALGAEWKHDQISLLGLSWVKRTAAIVDKQLGHPWRVSELAAELAVSVSAYAHGFRKEAGISPARWLVGRRVQAAQRLLQFHSVSEVAGQLGFSDAFHFSRTFKRLVGIPPSQYRKQIESIGLDGYGIRT